MTKQQTQQLGMLSVDPALILPDQASKRSPSCRITARWIVSDCRERRLRASLWITGLGSDVSCSAPEFMQGVPAHDACPGPNVSLNEADKQTVRARGVVANYEFYVVFIAHLAPLAQS